MAGLECGSGFEPYRLYTLSIWQSKFGPTTDSVRPGMLVWPAHVLPVRQESTMFIIQQWCRVFFTTRDESIAQGTLKYASIDRKG